MNLKRVIDVYCKNDGKVKKIVDCHKANLIYYNMIEHNDKPSLCDGIKQKTVKELFDYFTFVNPNGVDFQVIDDETGEVKDVYENMDDCIEGLQNLEALTGNGENLQGENKAGNVESSTRTDSDGATNEKSEVKEKITEKTNE